MYVRMSEHTPAYYTSCCYGNPATLVLGCAFVRLGDWSPIIDDSQWCTAQLEDGMHGTTLMNRYSHLCCRKNAWGWGCGRSWSWVTIWFWWMSGRYLARLSLLGATPVIISILTRPVVVPTWLLVAPTCSMVAPTWLPISLSVRFGLGLLGLPRDEGELPCSFVAVQIPRQSSQMHPKREQTKALVNNTHSHNDEFSTGNRLAWYKQSHVHA